MNEKHLCKRNSLAGLVPLFLYLYVRNSLTGLVHFKTFFFISLFSNFSIISTVCRRNSLAGLGEYFSN